MSNLVLVFVIGFLVLIDVVGELIDFILIRL